MAKIVSIGRLSLGALILAAGLSLTSAADGPRPAPAFTLPARAGSVSLDSLRGKLVLVDFWASWCVPCRASFPWMAELQRRYAADGLVIVAIDLDKDPSLADRFLDLHPAPFTIAFDPAGRTAEAYAVKAMPSSFLIGRDGTILHRHAGFDSRKASVVEDLIREATRP